MKIKFNSIISKVCFETNEFNAKTANKEERPRRGWLAAAWDYLTI